MYSKIIFTAFLAGCEIVGAAVAHVRTGIEGRDMEVVVEEFPAGSNRLAAERWMGGDWDPAGWQSMAPSKHVTHVSTRKAGTTDHKTVHHKSTATKKTSAHSDATKHPKSTAHSESVTHPKVSPHPKPSTHQKQLTHSEAAPSAHPTSYAGIVVRQHNMHRVNHSAPDIQWSDDLAATAYTIASSCVYAHNTNTNGGGYGQNIAAGTPPDQVSAVITNEFYNSEVNWFSGLYGEAQPSMTNFEHWGHFSQIVWKETSHVGCATKHCPSGLGNVGTDVAKYFTVCNYMKPGNFLNEYGKNIGKPLGHPTVYGAT